MGARAGAGERGLRSIGVREDAAARSRCAGVHVARRPGATVRHVLVCAAYRENAGCGMSLASSNTRVSISQ